MKQAIALEAAAARTPSVLADYISLTKPRITLMVVLTGAMGYYMGSTGGVSLLGLLHVMIGVALVASGASTLNQVREREPDSLMNRTANRAIPSGRVSPHHALLFGVLLGLTGCVYITLFLDPVTAMLAVATLVSYVFIYTPLKRVTTMNTLVGAIPGAIPPMGGWAAATGGQLGAEAWTLFAILFLWQIPHFLALAWMLKDDYAQGGFRMLPVVDPDGRTTGVHIAITAAAMIPVALIPTLLGMTGGVYFASALVLTLAYAGLSLDLAFRPNLKRARHVFLASVLYLPLLMGAMLLDKLPA